jgi:hypothetical protein
MPGVLLLSTVGWLLLSSVVLLLLSTAKVSIARGQGQQALAHPPGG